MKKNSICNFEISDFRKGLVSHFLFIWILCGTLRYWDKKFLLLQLFIQSLRSSRCWFSLISCCSTLAWAAKYLLYFVYNQFSCLISIRDHWQCLVTLLIQRMITTLAGDGNTPSRKRSRSHRFSKKNMIKINFIHIITTFSVLVL